MILAQRDECLREIACVGAVDVLVRKQGRQAAEIIIGARLVHRHAVPVRIHAAKLPKGSGNALLGGVFELEHRLVRSTLTQCLRARAECLKRGRGYH
jgi:hypothetical protein